MILLVKDHAPGEKGIVLCQNKGECICQFYGKEEDDEEIDGLAIFCVSL